MLSAVLVPLFVAVVVALIATRLAMAVFARLRFLDQPGSEAHKQQTRATPYGGGLAMLVAIIAALVAALFFPLDVVVEQRWIPVAIGAGLLFALGCWDDARRVRASIKLFIQAVVAAGVVWTADLGLESLQIYPVLGSVVAWAWLVLVSNAYNLLDHDDGLCASIAIVSAVVLVSGAVLSGDMSTARIYVIMIGALIGFLWWNRPPARIYMGDAGSLPLGFMIGVGTLSVTFWPSGESGSPLAVLSPVLITALPLFDTISVIIKRWRARVPIMQGDRNHISHRLQRLGMTPKRRLLTAVAVQVALAAGALQLRTQDELTAIIIIAQAAAIFVVVVLLETARSNDQQ